MLYHTGLFFTLPLNFILDLCVYVRILCVEVGEQLAGVSSLLSKCESWESKDGHCHQA